MLYYHPCGIVPNPNPDDPVHHVSVNANYSVAVRVGGGLYAWGFGRVQSQLGLGDDREKAETPAIIVGDVACGGQHALELLGCDGGSVLRGEGMDCMILSVCYRLMGYRAGAIVGGNASLASATEGIPRSGVPGITSALSSGICF